MKQSVALTVANISSFCFRYYILCSLFIFHNCEMLMRTYRVLLWGIIIYSVGELSEKCQRLVLYIYMSKVRMKKMCVIVSHQCAENDFDREI